MFLLLRKMTSRWSRKRKIYAEFQQCLHLISDNDDNDAEHVEIDRAGSSQVQQAAQVAFGHIHKTVIWCITITIYTCMTATDNLSS